MGPAGGSRERIGAQAATPDGVIDRRVVDKSENTVVRERLAVTVGDDDAHVVPGDRLRHLPPRPPLPTMSAHLQAAHSPGPGATRPVPPRDAGSQPMICAKVGAHRTVTFSVFFSRRRRHTRCGRDWSSDVCSSDLITAVTAVVVVGLFFALLTVERAALYGVLKAIGASYRTLLSGVVLQALVVSAIASAIGVAVMRSEERREGKEGRARGAPVRVSD